MSAGAERFRIVRYFSGIHGLHGYFQYTRTNTLFSWQKRERLIIISEKRFYAQNQLCYTATIKVVDYKPYNNFTSNKETTF
jgi:hypothetical protein